MYVEEMAKMPASVTFLLPEGWKTSTGLISINNKNIYYAQDAKALLYSPAFVGKFQRWTFTERGIPHEIVYWKFSNVTWFDTVLLINNIKRIVHQTINFFGSAPYKNYTFLLHDGAYGAQEYPNSVTIGIPSQNFKRDIIETNEAVAHEYFHAWNSMALRPAGYSEIHHNAQEKVKELWWNEGLTMFYTDLLLRRAGISVDDSTRTMHLQKLIGSYFSNPGNFKISPEKSSLETNEQPGGMGDYYSSVHLQGEVIGAMLDLIIRDATNSTKSIDDVMRRMFYDFPEKKGFSSSDVERTVENICGCDIHPFFEKYINNANIIDFNQYLKLIGKKVQVTWSKAMDNEKSSPDLINIFPWIKRGENVVRIGLRNPESCWGKAGLHTGDKVVTLNNLPINSIPSFRKIQGSLQVGDKAEFMINRNSEIRKVVVTVQGYEVPAAHITSIGKSTSKQKKLFKVWSDSK
jgi:predicted metalloprotease with PDZ domain